MSTEPALDLPVVEYAERSDPGRDPSKQVNEDACGRRETRVGHLCVVCDGMGGHAAGREAAELALTTIFEAFDCAPEGSSPSGTLRAAIEQANRRVFAMPTSEASLGRPGSTVVAVLMHPRGTEVAHVGDSRAYLVHEGQISRLTRDHSIVQQMVDRGLLTVPQAADHPDANRITRALGVAPEVETDVRRDPVHHVTGDAFVLCSDGLSDLVEEQEILDAVGDAPAAQAVGKLVALANARGGHDNITVLVLRARSSATDAQGTGVAPTIAQTNVQHTALLDPMTREPDNSRAHRETQRATPALAGPTATAAASPLRAPLLASLASAPLDPTLPPTAVQPTLGQRIAPAAIAVLVIGAVAFAGMSAMIVMHFADRDGRHDASREAREGGVRTLAPTIPTDARDEEAGPAATNLTPLVPDGVEISAPRAPAGEPGEILAPLEPPRDKRAMPRRKKQ